MKTRISLVQLLKIGPLARNQPSPRNMTIFLNLTSSLISCRLFYFSL